MSQLQSLGNRQSRFPMCRAQYYLGQAEPYCQIPTHHSNDQNISSDPMVPCSSLLPLARTERNLWSNFSTPWIPSTWSPNSNTRPTANWHPPITERPDHSASKTTSDSSMRTNSPTHDSNESSKWSTAFINALWQLSLDLWDLRNQTLRKSTPAWVAQKRVWLQERVSEYYKQHQNLSLGIPSQWFDTPLEDKQRETTDQLIKWIQTIDILQAKNNNKVYKPTTSYEYIHQMKKNDDSSATPAQESTASSITCYAVDDTYSSNIPDDNSTGESNLTYDTLHAPTIEESSEIDSVHLEYNCTDGSNPRPRDQFSYDTHTAMRSRWSAEINRKHSYRDTQYTDTAI